MQRPTYKLGGSNTHLYLHSLHITLVVVRLYGIEILDDN